MTTYERMMWNGELVTVIGTSLRKIKIRDSYGFVWDVRKKDLVKLSEGDDRKYLRVP